MSSPNALRQLDSTTLADQAYGAIREAIVSGELESREKITERGLAERLAVSATPVREALRRLEQDGLVERTGPRTVQVVDFDDRSVAEIRLAEGALRVVAASLAATNATAAQLARMERCSTPATGSSPGSRRSTPTARRSPRADLAGILRITREFHAELNAGCNNPVVLRLLQHGRRVQPGGPAAQPVHRGRATAVATPRPTGTHDHRRIFEAVRDGDAASRRTTDDRTHPRRISYARALTYTTPGEPPSPAPNRGGIT